MKRLKTIFLFIVCLTVIPACRGDQMEKEPFSNAAVASPGPEIVENNASIVALPSYNDYNLTLIVNPESRTVDAIEKIRFTNQTGMELDSVYFNVYLNAFSKDSSQKPYLAEQEDKVFQNGRDYADIQISQITQYNESLDYQLTDTSLKVMLHEPLRPEEPAEIVIAFSAYIPKINHRIGADDNAMWFGNFIPTLAVYDEYGWHNRPFYPVGDPFYTDIANFTATIVMPTDYIMVSTGIENSLTTDNEKTTVTLATKLTRDFAFYVAKGHDVDRFTTGSGVDINLYTRRNTGINKEEYFRAAAAALDYFSEKVGAYPYSKLDLVETGLFANTFKAYPEMVFMDSAYMEDPRATRSLVHHIGHQWFYNIIGNNGVKEPWLAEGLVMYLQERLLSGDEKTLRQTMLDDYQDLKEQLKTMENKALLQDLSVYSDRNTYYQVQFVRSSLMVYAMHRKLGEEKFAEFLKTYYNRYSFHNVNRKEFIDTAEEVYGDSLTDFFDGWMSYYDLPPL